MVEQTAETRTYDFCIIKMPAPVYRKWKYVNLDGVAWQESIKFSSRHISPNPFKNIDLKRVELLWTDMHMKKKTEYSGRVINDYENHEHI